jgi:hypothetical protein
MRLHSFLVAEALLIPHRLSNGRMKARVRDRHSATRTASRYTIHDPEPNRAVRFSKLTPESILLKTSTLSALQKVISANKFYGCSEDAMEVKLLRARIPSALLANFAVCQASHGPAI